MSKILLLDTSFAARPIYEYLLSTNLEVWVMGNRPNDSLALQAGEYWINQDYSDIDAVRNYVENLNIDFIVPGCTDLSIEICLKLNHNNHLDSLENHSYLSDKAKFRALCHELGLGAPAVKKLNDFPCDGQYICKPTDSFSGKGVTVFNGQDLDSLPTAITQALRESESSSYIIESFEEGQLYSFSCFIENRKSIENFLVKEGSSVNKYAVDTSYVDFDVESTVIDKLQSSVEKIANRLDLKDGLLHIQFILNKNNEIFLIEVCRRCPGDLYPLLISNSTGYNYAAKYASYFIQSTVKQQLRYQREYIRHTVASVKCTVFNYLQFNVSLSIQSIYPLLSLGSRVEASQKTRVAILFITCDDIESRNELYDQFLERNVYII